MKCNRKEYGRDFALFRNKRKIPTFFLFGTVYLSLFIMTLSVSNDVIFNEENSEAIIITNYK